MPKAGTKFKVQKKGRSKAAAMTNDQRIDPQIARLGSIPDSAAPLRLVHWQSSIAYEYNKKPARPCGWAGKETLAV
jgi:hypothetical protein